MKFDVVIGNPPYQKSDGGHGASAKAIYNDFVEKAKEWEPDILSFVIPARWTVGGKGMTKFRKTMLNDTNIEHLKIFPNSKDCFPDNDIMGGICYFIRNVNHSGDCEVVVKDGSNETSDIRALNEIGDDLFVINKMSADIVSKVKDIEAEFMDTMVSASKPFGLRTFYKGKDTGEVLLYQNGGQAFCDLADLLKNQSWTSDYKVLIPYAYGCTASFGAKVIGKAFVADPGSACTETYLVVNRYDSLAEAENMVSFLKTKFARFMISILKKTQHGTRGVYRFVPALDMNKKWVDSELYERYDLNQDEIDFIEKKIKVMV
tara:strand:- start:2745 stop:3698 length:954 start_codon:yes stop_codon:yes gene_type:complete